MNNLYKGVVPVRKGESEFESLYSFAAHKSFRDATIGKRIDAITDATGFLNGSMTKLSLSKSVNDLSLRAASLANSKESAITQLLDWEKEGRSNDGK